LRSARFKTRVTRELKGMRSASTCIFSLSAHFVSNLVSFSPVPMHIEIRAHARLGSTQQTRLQESLSSHLAPLTSQPRSRPVARPSGVPKPSKCLYIIRKLQNIVCRCSCTMMITTHTDKSQLREKTNANFLRVRLRITFYDLRII